MKLYIKRLALLLFLCLGLTVQITSNFTLGLGVSAYANFDEDDEDDGWNDDGFSYFDYDSAADYYCNNDSGYNPYDGDNPFTSQIEGGSSENDANNGYLGMNEDGPIWISLDSNPTSSDDYGDSNHNGFPDVFESNDSSDDNSSNDSYDPCDFGDCDDGGSSSSSDDTSNDAYDDSSSSYGDNIKDNTSTTESKETTQPEKIPCSPEKDDKAIKTSELFNQSGFKADLDQLSSIAKTKDAGESSFILKNNNGEYTSGGLTKGSDTSAGSADVTINTPGAVAEAHNHTTEGYSCFSDRDLMGLQDINLNLPDFKTIYVVGSESTYALVVNDLNALTKVKQNYGGSLDANNNFTKNTKARINYNDAYDALRLKGFSDEDACAQAKAYMYEKMGMGVSLLKAEKDENGNTVFKELNTTLEKDANGNDIVKATKCE